MTLPAAMLDEGGFALLGRGGERSSAPTQENPELQAGGERRQPYDTNTTHRRFSPELTQLSAAASRH
jgi:hypothetical protein